MTDAIAKLNAILGKVLAYGPSRKKVEKQKKRVKKAQPRKKQNSRI